MRIYQRTCVQPTHYHQGRSQIFSRGGISGDSKNGIIKNKFACIYSQTFTMTSKETMIFMEEGDKDTLNLSETSKIFCPVGLLRALLFPYFYVYTSRPVHLIYLLPSSSSSSPKSSNTTSRPRLFHGYYIRHWIRGSRVHTRPGLRTSFERDIKPWVLCRSFTARKRTSSRKKSL